MPPFQPEVRDVHDAFLQVLAPVSTMKLAVRIVDCSGRAQALMPNGESSTQLGKGMVNWREVKRSGSKPMKAIYPAGMITGSSFL